MRAYRRCRRVGGKYCMRLDWQQVRRRKPSTVATSPVLLMLDDNKGNNTALVLDVERIAMILSLSHDLRAIPI